MKFAEQKNLNIEKYEKQENETLTMENIKRFS